MTDSEQGITHLSEMNKIFRQIFPHIPERNQIHHFNPWHGKASPSSYSSSFTRFPAALPLYQYRNDGIDSSNNGHTVRFLRDPLPLEIGSVPDVPKGGDFGFERQQGLINPISDPGDDDGFIDVLQVASNERGLERMEQQPRIPSDEVSHDLNKLDEDETNQFMKHMVDSGDRPRSMISSGHHGLHGRKPEPAALGKRGPECMRRCIAQGVLHPVQCHSLC